MNSRLLILGLLLTPLMAAIHAADESIPPPRGIHWAFVKPERPELPRVRDASWVRTPIDAFILARLEQVGLKPSLPADRAALLRRVTIDLTGLPPTLRELEDFLNDSRPDAYERVVERLLASPHHGERWAQHWLDVARYAESNGYELDAERPHAWRYRDYVIRSFNEDKPYDRFLTEQLAGDLLAQRSEVRGQKSEVGSQKIELLIASGFNRCGPIHLVSGNTNPEINRQEVLTEMTVGVGSAFLGLTVGCARCHDHKFDPLPQADYYRLQAFFAATQPKDIDIATQEERTEREKRVQELNALLVPLRKQVTELDSPYRQKLTEAKKSQLEPMYREALAVEAAKRTPEQVKLAAHAQILIKVTWDEVIAALTPADREKRSGLREKIHALEAQLPPPSAHAWSLADSSKVPPTHVLKRGNPKNKLEQVTPGVPKVLERTGDRDLRSNRLDLAAWLTKPDHPLTARVMVNRLWHHHLGRGLVGTPNDFGLRGDRPTHPELLDWLACEFAAPSLQPLSPHVGGEGQGVRGWSLKHLHRLMVLSATYQQSSRSGPSSALDPDNRLLGRMNRRRLESELLRDTALAVAGRLNPRTEGPMIRVPLEPEVYDLIFTEDEPDGLWHTTPDPREHTRRSIYLFAKRNVRLPLFEAFDQPDSLTSCPVRPVSIFAPQALILMNGPFMQEQARAFAGRLLRECGQDADQLIDRAHRVALSRPAREGEVRLSREFLTSQAELLRDRLRSREPVALPRDLPAGIDPALAAALVDYCLAMLNRNEFVYVP